MKKQSRRPHGHSQSATSGRAAGGHFLFGRHAVTAALANPRRQCQRLLASKNALAALDAWPKGLAIETVEPQHLDRVAGPDAVHQGLILFCAPLPPAAIETVLDAAAGAPLLLLDQVTDPQNVGAIMRSAAAFGAAAIITQDRHSPPESPALAKAASGALEILPRVQVVNLARALEQVAQAGYWRIGLDGSADAPLAQVLAKTGPACLVLGAEGRGLRPNVASHCDQLAKLPIDARVESLNVSNAAAVALYALRNRSA